MDELKRDIRRASGQNSLAIGLFIGITYLMAYGLRFLRNSGALGGGAKWVMMIAGALQFAVAVPLGLLIVRSIGKGREMPKLKEVFRRPRAGAGEIVRWIFISLFFVYAATLVSSWFFNLLQMLTGLKLHAIDLSSDGTAEGNITNIVLIMFLAPIFEEIMFRGTAAKNSSRFSSWGAVAALAVIFGLYHMNYAQTLYTSVLGLCTGFLLVKTGSIIPPMILHFCMNTIGTFQSLFTGRVDTAKLAAGDLNYIMEHSSDLAPLILTTFLVYGIMIAGLVLFIRELTKHPDTFRLETEEDRGAELSEGKKFALYFSSPVTIILTAALTAITVINAVK